MSNRCIKFCLNCIPCVFDHHQLLYILTEKINKKWVKKVGSMDSSKYFNVDVFHFPPINLFSTFYQVLSFAVTVHHCFFNKIKYNTYIWLSTACFDYKFHIIQIVDKFVNATKNAISKILCLNKKTLLVTLNLHPTLASNISNHKLSQVHLTVLVFVVLQKLHQSCFLVIQFIIIQYPWSSCIISQLGWKQPNRMIAVNSREYSDIWMVCNICNCQWQLTL